MEFLSALLNPNNPAFASSLGIGGQTPAAFGSLAPGTPMNILPAAAQTPGSNVGDIASLNNPGGGGFDQAKFKAALQGLQKSFGQQQQGGGGVSWMSPMNLKPPAMMQPLGMLKGF